MKEEVNERVHFRLLHMPCCNHQLCWVNPRLPTHCPECGKFVIDELRACPQHIRLNDREAWIKYHILDLERR